MDVHKRFGHRIRQLRQRAELTQKQLAARARLSATSLSNIECGVHAPGFRKLPRLAQALGVEVHELFLFDQ